MLAGYTNVTKSEMKLPLNSKHKTKRRKPSFTKRIGRKYRLIR